MSTYVIVRDVGEVEELMQRALGAESEGSVYPGMSYEQGIVAAIDWLTDEQQEYPFDE